MKKKQFLVEQIVAVLKQTELRIAVADLMRQVEISVQTYYRWKKLYSDMNYEDCPQT